MVIRIFLKIPIKHIDRTYSLYEVLPVPSPTPEAKENFIYTFINTGMDIIAIPINKQHFILVTQKQVDDYKGGNVTICGVSRVLSPI